MSSPALYRVVGSCLLLVALGCGRSSVNPTPAVIEASEEKIPSEIHLSDARVTVIEPKLIEFEVKYRFTKGKPSTTYQCDISFPGTPNFGVKLIQHWQLKEEGVIRDRIVLAQPGVKNFEISMGESASAQSPGKKISNVVKGAIP